MPRLQTGGCSWPDVPFTFIDTAGCGFDEKPVNTSVANPEEAAFLFKYLTAFTNQLKTIDFPSVAVISPYSEQIRLMKGATCRK